jgi:nucleotide-binding universal stress UspA family protein
MYERVLVAVDHSDVAQRALAAARELVLLSKGEVWVLHLREREVIAQMGDVPSESAADAGSPVSAAVEELTKAGVTAHGEVRNTTYGHAAREILADAKEHDVGVIVMGTRGRSELTGLVVGSTAHKVIHLADRPVLVVR